MFSKMFKDTMINKVIYLLALIAIILIANVQSDCISLRKVRYSRLSYIKCNNTTLQEGVPLPSNTTLETRNMTEKIMFFNSTLTIVPTGIFINFPTTSELYMTNSGVNQIQPFALRGLTNLTYLYLQNNNITEIRDDMFNYLEHLKILHISYNKISSLKNINVPRLQELYLNNNYITILNNSDFKHLSQLVVLDISYNNITTISSDVFTENSALEQLYINNNNIKVIPDGLFNTITSIRRLNVTNNAISAIPCATTYSGTARPLPAFITKYYFHGIKQRYFMDFSYNELKCIPAALYNVTDYVYSLSFSFNNIQLIHSDSFVGFHFLKQLNISHNYIYTINIGTFRDLAALTSLDLSSNNIQRLEHGSFSGLNSLTVLDLSNNKFTTIDESHLYSLTLLHKLYLSGNNLYELNATKITSHFKYLNYITLNFEYITCESLINLMTVLKKDTVNVLPGNVHSVNNVKGIPCESQEGLVTTDVKSVEGTTSTNLLQTNIRIYHILVVLTVILVLFISSKLIYMFINFMMKRKISGRDSVSCRMELLNDHN